jgi:signal transduction histidine kinase
MIIALLALIIGYLKLLWAREKRMREVRRDISQDLHDEIGSYLTGISMNMDLMQKNKDKEAQYKQTIRLLGRKSLLALKDGLWSLDPGSDTAEQFWDRIKSITKEMLESLDIAYAFSDPPGLQQIRLTMLEKRNLVFIVKECITNCIKHGDGNMVVFTWENRKGRHVITIQNGIGNSGKQKDGGQGLVHIRNRMQRIQGDAAFQTDENEFKVILQLLFIHDRIRHYRR